MDSDYINVTTLIKNIQLIDGIGRAPYKADVLIKRQKISSIGHFPRYIAHEMIDGRGAYLSPGFIDSHSTIDRYLSIFSGNSKNNPANLLLQGVTTVIGGQDGFSLAPLHYGSLKFLDEWTKARDLNVNWHSVKEFLYTLRKILLPVNFGTLVGYRTIRQSILGQEPGVFMPNELKIFKFMLERSLKEGAFGISIGPEDLKSEVSFPEIRSMLEILSRYGAVHAKELHGESEERLSIVRRIINMTEEIKVKTIINHLEPSKGKTDYDAILSIIQTASARADIAFDIYCGETRTLPGYELLLDWVAEGDESHGIKKEKILSVLRNKEVRQRIEDGAPKIKGSDIVIVSAPEHEYLEGKTLGEVSRNRRLTLTAGLLELIELTQARVIVSFKMIDFPKMIKELDNKHSIIAAADRHFKKVPANTLPNFLNLIEKNKVVPIETAVHKLTALPALKLGIRGRGVVQPGYLADLTIFRDGEVKDVLVNGTRAVADGKLVNTRSGEVLVHRK